MANGVILGRNLVHKGSPVYVIAEIGINHNGRVEMAKKLIDVAVQSGCDAVKFQKRTITNVYTKEELAKPRDVPTDILLNAAKRGVLPTENLLRLRASDFQNSTNGDLKWALEFTKDEYREIDAYCRGLGIAWFASPWDIESVDFLEEFDLVCHKIASASLTDVELLSHIRSKGRPVILSTGMSTMDQIRNAVSVLGKDNLIILHCTSTYPCSLEEVNLKVMGTLENEFNVPIGFSGHEVGIGATIAAAVMGACVIERHITLDRSMWGSDQSASLEPEGIRRVVGYIRNFETAQGDGVKKVYNSELPIISKLRKK